MYQPVLIPTPSWSVSNLTRYLRDLLLDDPTLQDIWVQGEVSNLSRPASGHIYFTLKDPASALKCVMWRNAAARLGFALRDGQAVEVHGGLNIYEASGQYQLYADQIRPAGEGALYQEFLRLKSRLEAEGLFALERKRPIPAWPQRIGIVTSPTGAALRDMLNTIRRRYPLAEVILAPSPVQGDEAPAALVAALQSLNRLAAPDVILLARGGGSIEDLWAFNDEQLARTIAASSAPVICGVGHETDFTIADFASDLRAPTPTAAAELATPDQAELRLSQEALQTRLQRAIESDLGARQWGFERLQHRLALRSPASRLASERQRLDELVRRGESGLSQALRFQRARLNGQRTRLEALSPLAVLQRGYALVSRADGSLLRSAAQAAPHERLEIRLRDGRLAVQTLPTDE